jgi:NAD(P)-dependent dehydrogenase (short-subunit alcohol dehydrogenase family)
MLERKSGKIVNISSVTGRTGSGTPLYAAAKAGVIGLTKGLAQEVGPQGINVNGISPGMGDTGFQIAARVPPEAKQRFMQMVPRRIMTHKTSLIWRYSASVQLSMSQDRRSRMTAAYDFSKENSHKLSIKRISDRISLFSIYR